MRMIRTCSAMATLLAMGIALAACSQPAATPALLTAVPTGTTAPTSEQAAATPTNMPTTPAGITAAPPGITATPPGATSESPVATETNPLGDIPDTQVFITYAAAPGNYSLEVPEGWARTTNGSDVRFADKFDGVSVALKAAASAPTAASARQNEVARLTQAERAFTVGNVTDVKLPGGAAVLITASANSDPDPVTGKQVRLEEAIYLVYQNGTLAMVKLWAPLGTDNVDQWKRMSESFQWK